MKRKILILILLIPSIVFAQAKKLDNTLNEISTTINNSVPENTIIAILDFSAEKESLGQYIQEQLTSQLISIKKIKIVTREHMDLIDEELNYQMSGVVSDETAISICQRLGAQALIFGQIEELNNNYRLQVKMLDVETGVYLLYETYSVSRSAKIEQLLGRAATYKKSSLGFLSEINMNSATNIAGSGGIFFDYSFNRKFSAGIKTNVSYDFTTKESSISLNVSARSPKESLLTI